jgi:hypothetical protein
VSWGARDHVSPLHAQQLRKNGQAVKKIFEITQNCRGTEDFGGAYRVAPHRAKSLSTSRIIADRCTASAYKME